MKPPPKVIDALTKELMDRGLIIEAGWKGFELMTVPKDAPAVQRTEMRNAFFAGAQHLFSSIMSVLDPGTDATPNDLRRMDQILAELKQFEGYLQARAKEHRERQ